VDADRIAEVRAELMSEIDWPATAGEVTAAAEAVAEPEVAAAASRLPDDGHWLDIDALWDDLGPLLEELVDRTGT
jgi:hypothetical protein